MDAARGIALPESRQCARLRQRIGVAASPLRTTDDLDSLLERIGASRFVRLREATGVVLVGFGTHHGTVIAGSEWEPPMERMRVLDAAPRSREDGLHGTSRADQLQILADLADEELIFERRGHRAIGVVYHPGYKRLGNYVPIILPERYDAFMFFDETEAVHPLRLAEAAGREPPETWPSGIEDRPTEERVSWLRPRRWNDTRNDCSNSAAGCATI